MYVIHQIIVIYYYLEKLLFLKYFDKKVKMNVMDYFYLIIKMLRGIRIEVDVERVFTDPQGEKTSGKSYLVRTKVMQEASSPKSSQDSLWSAKEREAHKWPSPRKNTIK